MKQTNLKTNNQSGLSKLVFHRGWMSLNRLISISDTYRVARCILANFVRAKKKDDFLTVLGNRSKVQKSHKSSNHGNLV